MLRNSMVLFLTLALFGTSSLIAQERRRPATPPAPVPAPVPPVPPNPQPPPQPPLVPATPVPGLTVAQLAAFTTGSTEFTSVEDVNDGLGPVFNGRSCAECHSVPTVGGASNRFVTRFGRTNGAVFDPLANLGGSLKQDFGIGPQNGSPHLFRAEVVPQAANVSTRRRTTPLFGLGYVDATPDSTFIALAAQQQARNDGTAGRVHMVDNISAGMQTVGKFGWKDQNPTLFQFSGDAYLNEMGITTPQFPNENCPQGNCAELAFNPMPGLNDGIDGVEELDDFMTLLGAITPLARNADSNAGANIFDRIGCNACHVANLQTGSSNIAALDHKTYHPYSDFLLHDMGSLGDGITQGTANGREMRTAPLWGLRFVNAFLHDSRASSLDQAILAHDGQAKPSRDRFSNLSQADRQRLIAFLRSL